MSDTPPPPESPSGGGSAGAEEPEPLILNCITPAMVSESKKWDILIYGIDDSDEIGNHHMDLLCGILGEKISYEKRTGSSFYFERNGVTVTIHMGMHDDCNVTSNEIDLLLYFLPVRHDSTDHSKISDITRKHGAMIWKHSVAILTGIDAKVDEFVKKQGSWITKLDTVLGMLTNPIQTSLAASIQENQDVAPKNLLIKPAGRHEKPDLLKPHEKWLSQIWDGCLLSSKETSMPAIIKLSQNRISYNVKTTDLQRPFHLQPIQTKEKGLSHKVKLALGLGGGGGAVAVGAVAGGTVGALTGAITLCVPTFGIAAKTGLALGLVVGAGVGASVAGAVNRTINERKPSNDSTKNELKLQYGEMVTNLPSVIAGLKNIAKGRATCKIVVTGIEGEDFSQMAASLAGKRAVDGTESYCRQLIEMRNKLVICSTPGFPKRGDKLPSARKVITATRDSHLLVLCIPMTYKERKFVHSPHAHSLITLSNIDMSIFSHMVIALTKAHNVSDQTDFKAELEQWKTDIRELLKESIELTEEVIQKIPILPVGDETGALEIPATERQNPPERYYWLTELLLHALPLGLSRICWHNFEHNCSFRA